MIDAAPWTRVEIVAEGESIAAALAELDVKMDAARREWDPLRKPQFADDVGRAGKVNARMAAHWDEYAALAQAAALNHRRMAAHWGARAEWAGEDSPRGAD